MDVIMSWYNKFLCNIKTKAYLVEGMSRLVMSCIFIASLLIVENAALAQNKSKAKRIFDNDFGILPGAELAAAYASGETQINTNANYTGEPFIFRYSAFQYEQYKANWAMKPAWNVLARETNGKIKIKPYWGNALHAFGDGFTSVESGISHESLCSSSFSPKSFDLNRVWSLPFIGLTSPVASRVYEDLYPKYFKQEYEKQGVYLGHTMMTSPTHIFSKDFPIRTLEDLRGKKIAVTGGDESKIIKALGGVPILLGTQDRYTAYQRGTVDAILTNDVAFTVGGLAEIGTRNYKTVLSLTITPLEACVNREMFDSMPLELKDIFYNWNRRFSQMLQQLFWERQRVQQALPTLEDRGFEVIHLSPSELARWKVATQPIVDDFIERNERKGLPVRELLADLKTLSERFSSMTMNEIFQDASEYPVQGIITYSNPTKNTKLD